MSFLGGGHLFYARTFMKLLHEKELSDVRLMIGGVIPPMDVQELNKLGLHAVFTPGTRRQTVLSRVAGILQ